METGTDFSPGNAQASHHQHHQHHHHHHQHHHHHSSEEPAPGETNEETNETILTKAYLREDGDSAYLRVECVAGPSSVGIEVELEPGYRQSPWLQPGITEQVEDLVECSRQLLRTLTSSSEDSMMTENGEDDEIDTSGGDAEM